jgi:hypothetical protein
LTFSTMANLAELDLAFSQPCRRCAQLLHGRVKFCPYCGGENDAPRWGDEAANTAFGPGHVAADSTEPAVLPADEPPIVPRGEVPEATDRPIVPEVRNEAREEVDLDIAHIVPAAFEWPEELPVGFATAEPRRLAPRRGPMLKYIAVGVAMAVSVLVLVLGYVRSDQEGEARRPGGPTAQRAPAQIAPSVGAAATPAEARQPAEAPAITAPAPVAAAPAPVAPVAAAPVPARPAQEAGKTGCNEALAALALCPDAGGAR